jgi:hypothetical protein
MTSLLLLLLLWIVCLATGTGLSWYILPRDWRREWTFIAPIFGAGALIILSSLASYAGLAMRMAAPFVAGSGLVLSIVCAMLARRGGWRPAVDWPSTLATQALGLAAGLSALLSVFLYRAWYPYNDTFTYLTIADFLQTNSFFTPATPTALTPLYSTVWSYQQQGFRMGSTFLLAFFTALVRAQYSFDLYLPVVALGLWVGVPAFRVLCRRALFLDRRTSLAATAAYALHVCLPITNALWGFSPQAWGAALLFPAIGLHVRATGRDRPRRIISSGLFIGMLLVTYTEIIPFALIAVATCYLARLAWGRLRMNDALVSGLTPIAVAIAVAPIAAWTFVPSMIIQTGAVVGWDPRYSLFDYIGLLAGYRSLALSFIADNGISGLAARIGAVIALATVLFAAFRGPIRARRQLALIGLVFALALGWFSIGARNPWNPNEFGHPWSTFKVATYVFFLVAALWGMGIVAFWTRGGVLRGLAALQVAGWFVVFGVANVATARQVSAAMQRYTGNKTDPIGEYKRLPGLLAEFPRRQPVNLIVPNQVVWHGRLVATFLQRPTLADWSSDDLIGPQVKGDNTDPRLPSLVFNPNAAAGTATANMVLNRDLAQVVGTSFREGWYGRESDTWHSWYWLEERGGVLINVRRGGTLTVKGDLAVTAAPSREITIAVNDHPELRRTLTVPQQWFTPTLLLTGHVEEGVYELVITASGPTGAMAPADPRQIRIGVRDLTVTVGAR